MIGFLNEVIAEDSDNPMWEDIEELSSNNECIFCDKRILRRNGTNQKLIKVASNEMKTRILEILGLQNLQEKINRAESENAVYYHLKCLGERDYKFIQSPKKRLTPKKQSVWSIQRDIHSIAFPLIKKHVAEGVIDKKEVLTLTEIFNVYSAIFEEKKIHLGVLSSETKFKAHHLLNKLLQSLPALAKTVYKNRTYMHRNDLTIEEILSKVFENKELIKQIKSTAFAVR